MEPLSISLNSTLWDRKHGLTQSFIFRLGHILGLSIILFGGVWLFPGQGSFSLPKGGVWLLAGLAACYVVAASITERLLHFPGRDWPLVILSGVWASYVVLTVVLLAGRFYYSRPYLLAAFSFTAVWFVATAWARRRVIHPVLAYIPHGHAVSLEGLGIELHELQDPRAPLEPCDGIVADLHAPELSQWSALIGETVLRRIPLFHSVDVYESLTGRVPLSHLSTIRAGEYSAPSRYFALKRAMDIVIVLLAAPIVIPVALITAVAIRFDSPGSVLFRQERVGLAGKPFSMLKFRSMCMESEKDGARFAAADDDRVTRLGRFIRKCRIDELPQMWNVLRGDMSVIGPRPEQASFVQQFEGEIPFYAYRHAVRPGISGWAQVTQGYAAGTVDTRVKLEHDFYYIKHVSLWLDLLVVVRTVRVILTGFGSR